MKDELVQNHLFHLKILNNQFKNGNYSRHESGPTFEYWTDFPDGDDAGASELTERCLKEE